MKGIESRCRSAVEANPPCVHLNESKGDQTKWPPLAHLQFKQAAQPASVIRLQNTVTIWHYVSNASLMAEKFRTRPERRERNEVNEGVST